MKQIYTCTTIAALKSNLILDYKCSLMLLFCVVIIPLLNHLHRSVIILQRKAYSDYKKYVPQLSTWMKAGSPRLLHNSCGREMWGMVVAVANWIFSAACVWWAEWEISNLQ